MEKCPKCGAERHRLGVLYPARRLCPCEERTCSRKNCSAPAVVVEFQISIKGLEPKLPPKANLNAVFCCEDHLPADFPTIREEPEENIAETKHVSQAARKRLPNVDPAWGNAPPPLDAMSSNRVECWKCHDTHALKSRKMHNGSMSSCPKCGDDMHTPAD